METSQIVDIAETSAANYLNNHSVSLFENAESSPDIVGQIAGLNNNGNIYVTMFIYLAAIVVMIAGLLFLRKYLTNRLGTVKNGAYMRILDRLVISQDKQIVLIELKAKILIVGITHQRIETLSEFSKDEFDVIAQDVNNIGGGSQGNSGGFMQILSNKLKVVNKSDENDKK